MRKGDALRDLGRAVLFLGSAFAMTACGYRPLYGGGTSEALAVTAMAPTVADAAVLAEIEAGARSGLARAGALRGGSGFPRIVIEVLRVEVAPAGLASRDGMPLARGSRVVIVAQAWLERSGDGAFERATGEVAVEEVVGVEARATVEVLREDEARRLAARQLGERLARRIRGEAEAAPGM